MAHSQTPVVFLAFANDVDARLRELAQEQDDIAAIFRQAERDGRCKVVRLASATVDKVIEVFQEYRGRIRVFHYGGHSDQDTIFLRSDDFRKQVDVKADKLADFLALQEDLELVFLNSCLSLSQAAKYHDGGVKTVIATNTAIGDTTARQFAQLFYRSMATGADIKQAYQEAEKGLKLDHPDRWRVGRIESHAEKALDQFPWQLFPEARTTPWWRLPLRPVPPQDQQRRPHFVTDERPRRQEKLLQRLLVLGDIQAAFTEHPVLWLHGPSGYGKTVLAEQYYHHFHAEYQHVAWIEVKQDFLQDFIAAAPEEVPISEIWGRMQVQGRHRPKIEQKCAQAFSQFLANLSGQVLLVIDGVKNIADLEPYYDLLQLSNAHVLITSHHVPDRSSRLHRSYRYGELASPQLTDEEIQLLANQHEHDYPWTPEVLTHLRRNVLLSSILFKNVPRAQPAQLDEQLDSLLRQEPSEAMDTSLLTRLFRLYLSTPAERWVLLQWAALPEGFYDLEFVAHLIGLLSVDQKLDTQGYKFFLDQPAYRAREKSTGWFGRFRGLSKRSSLPLVSFTEVIDSLFQGGWLVANEEEEFSLHTALVPVLQRELAPRLDYFTELSDCLYSAFFLQEEVGYEQVEVDDRLQMRSNIQYENHLRSLLELVEEESSEEFLDLLHKRITILEVSVNLAEELRMREQYVRLLEIREANNSLQLSVAFSNLGNCYYRNGRYQEALEHHQKSLAIEEVMLDTKHPDLASAYNNVALTHTVLGQYEQALKYHQKSLTIRKAVLDAKHPDLANSYNSIAVTYQDLGQYEQALDYQQKSLTIRKAVLDAKHPDLANSYNNIAVIYHTLGQYKQALEYHQKDLAIKQVVLDAKHPDLANSYNNIGRTFQALGQFEQALDYQQKSLTIRKAVLDANHPDLANSYDSIARTYRALGQRDQALAYNQKALIITEAVLDANHPDLANVYHSIALTYRSLEKLEEALKYLHKAIQIRESAESKDQKRLAESYSTIADTLRDLGKDQQAEEYQAKAKAIETRRME